jgi:hypothetical protein
MTKVSNAKLRFGHAPGHVHEAAGAAFRAWKDWDGNGPEPTVEFYVNYQPHRITISRACGLVWNCTDIMPGQLFDWLVEDGLELEPRRRTYAAVARAIVMNIKSTRAVTRAIASAASSAMDKQT